MNYGEYLQKKVPPVKKAPRIPDLASIFPDFSWCGCQRRKVWLNAIWSRLFMLTHKILGFLTRMF